MSTSRRINSIVGALIVIAMITVICFRCGKIEEKKEGKTVSESQKRIPAVVSDEPGKTGEDVETDKRGAEIVREDLKPAVKDAAIVKREPPSVESKPEVIQEPAEIVEEKVGVGDEAHEIVEKTPVSAGEKPQVVREEPDRAGYIYTIQVASFHYLTRAELLVERLKTKKYRAYISPQDLEKQGRWYRVFVGEFDSRAEVDSQLSELRKKFDDSFIRFRRRSAE